MLINALRVLNINRIEFYIQNKQLEKLILPYTTSLEIDKALLKCE